MKLSFVKEGTVLVRLNKAEKRKIFQTDFTGENGEVSTFIHALRAGSEMDEYYSQSVLVGEVINKAEDVDQLEIGDTVILDYTADVDESCILESDGFDEKIISLEARTSFYKEDKLAYASMRSRVDTYTWRIGDVDKLSLIYAILRNGVLVPNYDYILLEHKDLTWTGETKTGITFYKTEGDVVIRKVIGASKNSLLQVGDMIAVEAMNLLERSIEEYNFDIIMNIDVLGKIEIPVLQ